MDPKLNQIHLGRRHTSWPNIMVSMLMTALFSMQALAIGSIAKPEFLNQLRAIKNQNYNQLRELDQELRQALQSSYQAEVKQTDPGLKQNKLFAAYESQMERLVLKRREFLLRQEFLDRLIFQVDSKYQGDGLRVFLAQTLLEMTQTELLNQYQTGAAAPTPTWRFLNYLSLIVKNTPEPEEQLANFIASYMVFSSISNPLRPNEFLNQRHYTNGIDTQVAKPMARDQVGEIVEQRLKEVEVQEMQSKKDFQQRRPILKPVIELRSDVFSKKPAESQEVESTPSTTESK